MHPPTPFPVFFPPGEGCISATTDQDEQATKCHFFHDPLLYVYIQVSKKWRGYRFTPHHVEAVDGGEKGLHWVGPRCVPTSIMTLRIFTSRGTTSVWVFSLIVLCAKRGFASRTIPFARIGDHRESAEKVSFKLRDKKAKQCGTRYACHVAKSCKRLHATHMFKYSLVK